MKHSQNLLPSNMEHILPVHHVPKRSSHGFYFPRFVQNCTHVCIQAHKVYLLVYSSSREALSSVWGLHPAGMQIFCVNSLGSVGPGGLEDFFQHSKSNQLWHSFLSCGISVRSWILQKEAKSSENWSWWGHRQTWGSVAWLNITPSLGENGQNRDPGMQWYILLSGLPLQN